MEQTSFFSFILCCVITGLGEAALLPEYEHNEDVGWFRLHIVPATWADARLRCQIEGAALGSPRTSDIAVAMRNTMLQHNLGHTNVFTDMNKHNTKFNGDFTTIDGMIEALMRNRLMQVNTKRCNSSCSVLPLDGSIVGLQQWLPVSSISLQWAKGEPDNLNNDEDCLAMTGTGELADVSCSSVYPYICFKPDENKCDTHSEGYQLKFSTGSCYKFHRKALPWRRADMVCAAEDAHLAVINSELERRVLVKMFAQNPDETIEIESTSTGYRNYVHLGFLDWNEQSQWLTIFGDTLADAGFNKWALGEPNSPGVDNCGCMSRDGLLNDGSCVAYALPFICESSFSPREEN